MSALTAMSFNSLAGSSSLDVYWQDQSQTEYGFKIDRRIGTEGAFVPLTQVQANTTHYTDSDVVDGQTYCYRISAFNYVGRSESNELCATAEDGGGANQPFAGHIAVSHSYVPRPVVIDIADKELHAFRSTNSYNADYAIESITNVKYTAAVDKARFYGSNKIYFEQQGVRIDDGFATMPFNSGNKAEFVLNGQDTLQKAKLYLGGGVWSRDPANIIVTVGDKVEYLPIPSGYSWHYFAVDIEFDQPTPVTITTDSDHGGYSALQVSGVVFELPNVEPYGNVTNINAYAERSIDVTDKEYYLADQANGNSELSEASVVSLEYTGQHWGRKGTFTFSDTGVANTGYAESMPWKTANKTSLTLRSAQNQLSTASLYVTTGAWTSTPPDLMLTINGVETPIPLHRSYGWIYNKIDIEFEGKVTIELNPTMNLSGYSAFVFAGVTLE